MDHYNKNQSYYHYGDPRLKRNQSFPVDYTYYRHNYHNRHQDLTYKLKRPETLNKSEVKKDETLDTIKEIVEEQPKVESNTKLTEKDQSNPEDLTGLMTTENTLFNKHPTNLNSKKKKKWYSNLFTKKSYHNNLRILTVEQSALGDVMDSKQQQEMVSQLSNEIPKRFKLPPDPQKILQLDQVWVFRLLEPEPKIAWIGFDYENQLKIEHYLKHLETQPLVLYDSHIRHQSTPVIVIPSENKAYYFLDSDQNQIVSLEVTSIKNDHQKVTFVYRQPLE